MTLGVEQIRTLTTATPADAWRDIIAGALLVCAAPLSPITAPGEVTKRDRAVGELDRFLSQGAWDLWKDFGAVVERNSDRLAIWWAQPFAAKAILILDGLSLREIPWLVEGAKQRGLTVCAASAYGAELPSETNSFARALGFSSRSQLQNNGGGYAHRLAPCKTECIDLPWADCGRLIDSTPNWVFWHQWPDSKLHDPKSRNWPVPVWRRIGHFQWDDPGSTAYRRSPHR